MNWAAWVLIAFCAFTAVGRVALIGKRREPITPSVAAVCLLIDVATVWLVVVAAS